MARDDRPAALRASILGRVPRTPRRTMHQQKAHCRSPKPWAGPSLRHRSSCGASRRAAGPAEGGRVHIPHGGVVSLLFAATLLPLPVPVLGATSHICLTPVLAPWWECAGWSGRPSSFC